MPKDLILNLVIKQAQKLYPGCSESFFHGLFSLDVLIKFLVFSFYFIRNHKDIQKSQYNIGNEEGVGDILIIECAKKKKKK